MLIKTEHQHSIISLPSRCSNRRNHETMARNSQKNSHGKGKWRKWRGIITWHLETVMCNKMLRQRQHRGTHVSRGDIRSTHGATITPHMMHLLRHYADPEGGGPNAQNGP